jgi:tetratricopeptide (TPR) repeat protein
MVTLRTYWSQAEAAIAQTRLEAEGIVCALADENSNLYAGTGQVAIPIRLLVEEGSVDQARRILEEPTPLPDDFDPASEGDGSALPPNEEVMFELNRLRHTNRWILLGIAIIVFLSFYLVSELPNRNVSAWSPVYQARRQRDYDKAINLATALAAKNPNDYYVHEYLADMYWEVGDMDNAEKQYVLAYQLAPPQALQEKIEAVRRRRQHEQESKATWTPIPKLDQGVGE